MQLPVNFILNFINVFNSFLLLFLCEEKKKKKKKELENTLNRKQKNAHTQSNTYINWSQFSVRLVLIAATKFN